MEGLFGTILVSAIIVAIVALIIARMVKNKKDGKRGCAMGCSGCSQRQSCFVVNDNVDLDLGEDLDEGLDEDSDKIIEDQYILYGWVHYHL